MSPVVGTAVVNVRVRSDRLGPDISAAIRRAVRENSRDIDQQGERTGDRMGNAVRRGLEQNIGKQAGSFLFKAFSAMAAPAAAAGAAIGAAFIAEAGVALAGGAVALGAALGPGLAGAVGVGIAAVAELGLSAGLLALAFKSNVAGIKELSESWGEFTRGLGAPVAEAMLPGMTAAVDKLKGILPQIADNLALVGTAFGNVASGLADAFSRPEIVARFNSILETNAGFVGKLGSGISGLGESFLILWQNARPFIDAVGGAIERFGAWASQSLLAAEANGTLAGFMDRLLSAARQLGDILGNVGKGLFSVFSSAAPAGQDILTSIQGIAQRFADWTGDTANQAKMTKFFDTAKTVAGDLLHIIGQIAGGAGEGLGKTFDNLATSIGKIANSGVFERVGEIIGGITEKLSAFAASDFGAAILPLLGGLAAIAGPLSTIIGLVQTLIPLFAALTAPILGVVAAVAAAVGFFVLMWNNSEQLRTALSNLAEGALARLSEAWDLIQPKLVAVWEKLQVLAGVIGDRLAPVIAALQPVVEVVFTAMGVIIGIFVDILGGFIDFLIAVFTGDWSAAWEAIKSIATTIWEGIKAYFAAIWPQIQAIFQAAVNAISSWLSERWESIKSTASSIWNSIVGVASSAWNSVTSAITGAVDSVVGWLAGIWNDIANGVSSAFNRVISIATTAWNAVYDAIVQPVIDAYNAVTGWVSSIISSIESAIEWVGKLIGDIADANAAVLTAPSPGVVPGGVGLLGGFQIPAMAHGGIVFPSPGGSLVRVAEAGRRERIEPLNANGLSDRDQAMIGEIVRAVIGTMGQGGSRVDVAIDSGGLSAFIDARISHNEAALSRRVMHRRPGGPGA